MGWAALVNPYNLMRHMAAVVTFPLALAGVAEVLRARGRRQRGAPGSFVLGVQSLITLHLNGDLVGV